MKNFIAQQSLNAPRQFAHLMLWLFAGCCFISLTAAAQVSEPETVFYGKIINRTTGQVYLQTAGTLRWKIVRSDGSALTLSASLGSFNSGEFSYRLDVPQAALAPGLEVPSGAISLPSQPMECSHLEILVDGSPAQIITPGGSTFLISQARRASTYRLDLEVSRPLPSSGGNGLPDWWTAKYGVSDPAADPDGDGWNNLAEFLHGSDPKHDDRSPSLATREIRALSDSITMVRLKAVDSDTTPDGLVYTLIKRPGGGSLVLRNSSQDPTHPDRNLGLGDTFKQTDVDQGRLVFVHGGAGVVDTQTSFEVALSDGTAGHAAAAGSVAMTFYRPSSIAPELAAVSSASNITIPSLSDLPTSEQILTVAYVLGRDAKFITCDASAEAATARLAAPSSVSTASAYRADYVGKYGADKRHVFIGGAGADHISGSMEGDIIVGGGGDDVLRGGGGSDLFLLLGPNDGNDTIEDFNLAENDVIDLGRTFTGLSPWLTNYLKIDADSTNSYLRISSGGAGKDYTNMVITLAGISLGQSNLRDLVESGRLITGSKVLAPLVNILSTLPLASENGPASGEVMLTRSGPLESGLTVDLQITGSAADGVDYVYVPSQAVFASGQSVVKLAIAPYADALTELTEVVNIAILPGSGYEIGTPSSAQVGIEDLAPQISIEVLEPLASRADSAPGLFLISRAGVLDRSVLVKLATWGTAIKGLDCDALPTYVNLLPGQATALLPVNVKASAVLTNGAKYVALLLRPDPAYKIMGPAAAQVVLVDQRMTLPDWAQRNFGEAPPVPMDFAQQDAGRTGVANLLRYAFGLDPQAPQTSTGRPIFRIKDNHLTVEFKKPAAVADVQYVVEVSDDLVAWRSDENVVEQFFPAEYTNQVERIFYREKSLASEARTKFMRVRVVYAP